MRDLMSICGSVQSAVHRFLDICAVAAGLCRLKCVDRTLGIDVHIRCISSGELFAKAFVFNFKVSDALTRCCGCRVEAD